LARKPLHSTASDSQLIHNSRLVHLGRERG
jgi:hypothetical protein